MIIDQPTRRSMLATTSAAGVMLGTVYAGTAQTTNGTPQPSRAPGIGGTDPQPGDLIRERENPDMLNPRRTDPGRTPNLRFSFADAHVGQADGGWTRQVTKREFGVSKTIAGVEMRLNAGSVGELHWHKQAEWAYMLYKTARITAIDAQGRNFVDEVGVGDRSMDGFDPTRAAEGAPRPPYPGDRRGSEGEGLRRAGLVIRLSLEGNSDMRMSQWI